MSHDILQNIVRSIENDLRLAREYFAEARTRLSRSHLNTAQDKMERWRGELAGTDRAEDFAVRIKHLAFDLYIFPNGLGVEGVEGVEAVSCAS
jgi:hypothetical protein